MKYLLPLLFLAGCESFPEKKEPQLIETIPIRETGIEDMIDDSIKVGPTYVGQYTGSFDFFLKGDDDLK